MVDWHLVLNPYSVLLFRMWHHLVENTNCRSHVLYSQVISHYTASGSDSIAIVIFKKVRSNHTSEPKNVSDSLFAEEILVRKIAAHWWSFKPLYEHMYDVVNGQCVSAVVWFALCIKSSFWERRKTDAQPYPDPVFSIFTKCLFCGRLFLIHHYVRLLCGRFS